MNTENFKLIMAIIAVWFTTTATITAQGSKTMYVMKGGEVIYQSAVSDIDSVIFYKPVPMDGVLINGVVWAKYNVDAPGTFAANPESYGMFYQWSRPKGWPSSDVVTDWDPTCPEDNTWEEANDPSPVGWCLPTRDDILKLADTDKVTQAWVKENNVWCRKYTDNNTGNFILLPAAGIRYFTDGSNRLQGGPFDPYLGYYWGSESDDLRFASGFDFDSTETTIMDYYDRRYGFTIRCVAK